ncbi:2-keto-4-pentenoate hydratase [Gordonia sp. NPDC058843]|uniref:2-keto-4-pentenoate hydratase n=1 Tax=Gordonia sp. NPDC058843 TaxID=3346648 RepID=UPI0036B83CE5
MTIPTEPTVRIREAAQRLADAEATRVPCSPIRELIAPDDIDAAYEVQQRNVSAAEEAGRKITGRKIGLTSPAVQRQLGVDQPDFGVLYADMDVSSSTEIPINRLLQPKVEAEVAFVLARSITEPVTAETARDHVSEVIAAFEIVDSRVADWDISLADTIADNASSGLYVLGDRLAASSAPDLVSVTMTVTDAQGGTLSSGTGADCLGSPYSALAWLANTALRFGSPLQEGDVILSGALGPMVPVTPGATYRASISGIGSVTAAFTAN